MVGGVGMARAEPTKVVPGVTYERVQTPGQVVHVVRVRQGPLIDIRPVLTTGVPSRRTPLTSAMRARLGDGAVVGVNGDYFNLDSAYPSGLLMTAGELISEPEPTRSALVFGVGGALAAAQVELVGTWQASDPADPTPFPARTFIGVNRPPERASETLLYTPRYGDVTPTGDRVDALITMDDPAAPAINRPLTGTVHSVTPGGAVGIRPGMLVLSGVGAAGDNVTADLVPGRRITITATIAGLPADTLAAIGGGPALVQNGVALTSVTEGFSSGQIATPTSRTAIGQTADGTVLLVTAEGPFQGSRGVAMAEQAQLLQSLGAQTAVGMDGGGSATMALRDNLVIPWSAERAITDAVVVSYAGVQLTKPAPFLSPNGDGVDERSATTARSATSGSVRVALARSNGRPIRNLYRGPLGPEGRKLDLDAKTLSVPDGKYRIIARLTPSDGSRSTAHIQDVTIDRTLGFVRASKVGTAAAQQARIRFRLTKPTRLTIVVKDAKGGAVKVLFRNRRLAKGSWATLWDMTRKDKRVKPGLYTFVVSASTPLGRPTLAARVRVTALPKKPAAPAG